MKPVNPTTSSFPAHNQIEELASNVDKKYGKMDRVNNGVYEVLISRSFTSTTDKIKKYGTRKDVGFDRQVSLAIKDCEIERYNNIRNNALNNPNNEEVRNFQKEQIDNKSSFQIDQIKTVGKFVNSNTSLIRQIQNAKVDNPEGYAEDIKSLGPNLGKIVDSMVDLDLNEPTVVVHNLINVIDDYPHE